MFHHVSRLRGALDAATTQGQCEGPSDSSMAAASAAAAADDSPAIPPNRSALLHVLLNRQAKQRSPAPAPTGETGGGGGGGDAQAVRGATATEKVLQERQEFSESSAVQRQRGRDSALKSGAAGSATQKTRGERKSSVPEAASRAAASDPVSNQSGSGGAAKSGKKKKKSVSDLIARFEGGSASTSDLRSASARSASPAADRATRSLTPDDARQQQQRPVSAGANLQPDYVRAQSSDSVLERVPEEESPDQSSSEAPEAAPEAPQAAGVDLAQAINRDVLDGACALEITQEDLDIDPELLRQLQEEGVEIDEETKAMMRGNAAAAAKGGYTSYVFISSSDTGSTSSTSSGKKVVVSVKEPSSNCIVLQDGRASNISIVSTESSDLGSPVEDMLSLEPAPDIPAKIRARDGGVVDMQYRFLDSEPQQRMDYRTRGGEIDARYVLDDEELEEGVDDDEEDDDLTGHEESPASDRVPGGGGGGAALANYFTNSLEASSSPVQSSRRGRPPVIRAADRAARARMVQSDGGGGGYQYQHPDGYDITEVANEDGELYEEEYYDEQDMQHYDVRYESGEEEYVEDEDQEYPMCRPVYDDELDEEYDGEMGHGDEYFDREEELRGYNNRQIDFTLHTIIEESNEDSESDRSKGAHSPRAESAVSNGRDKRKRQSDPSELEKYFFYGVGDGTNETGQVGDTTASEDNSFDHSAQFDGEEEEEIDEDDIYYLQRRGGGGGCEQGVPRVGQHLPDLNAGGRTLIRTTAGEDSGSVGSESDGQQEDFKNRKKVRSKNRLSEEEGGADQPPSYSSCSSDEYATPGAFPSSSDDSTIKRKKNAPKKKLPEQSLSPKASPPITPLPSQIIEVQPVSAAVGREPNSGPEEQRDSLEGSKPNSSGRTNKLSAGISPPPLIPNVIRKHKSRDSGFVGSMDDLLRNENNSNGEGDSGQSLSDEAVAHAPRLEKVSEVSENTEDDADIVKKAEAAAGAAAAAAKKEPVERKDSFNQWSSDEDTNIMMSRMRAFFRGLLASPPQRGPEDKPQQLVAFEKELARLMRTVPGIREEQVKEIVGYLSSEDTWSDSCATDSSDYTSCGSDLEGVVVIPDLDMSLEIREQISKSCREIIEKFNSKDVVAAAGGEAEQASPEEGGDFQKETQLMYQKLMTKMHHDHHQQQQPDRSCLAKTETPMIASKVMQHISGRLVALMHEVKAATASEIAEAAEAAAGAPVPFADRRQIGPPARRFKRPSVAAKDAPADEGNGEGRVESGVRRKSLDDKVLWSKEQQQQQPRRRGSLKTDSDGAADEERVSWKGSFDSQLTSSNPRLTPRHSSANSSTRRSPSPESVGQPAGPRQEVISKPARQAAAAPQPKLGTSAIKKQLSDIEPQSVSLATSLAAGPMPPRSARYRPPGYRKPSAGAPPQRKNSPSSPGAARRPSFADRYTGRNRLGVWT